LYQSDPAGTNRQTRAVKVVLTHDFDEEDAERLRALAPGTDVQRATADGLAAELTDADAVLCFRLRPEDTAGAITRWPPPCRSRRLRSRC
jgi:hypothetical protein